MIEQILNELTAFKWYHKFPESLLKETSIFSTELWLCASASMINFFYHSTILSTVFIQL